MQTLESLRREVGLSKIDLLALLGLTEAQGEMLFLPDWGVDPDADGIVGHLSKQALAIKASHRHFREALKQEVDEAFRTTGARVLTTGQAARALGIGEFNLANLVRRKKLSRDSTAAGFTRKELYNLIDRPIVGQELNSPFAADFLAYWNAKRPVAVG